LRAVIVSDRFEGEAREVARAHAAIVRSVTDHGTPFAPPVVLLSGGETTVTVRGDGVGGRNLEFALAFALELQDATPWTLSAGTDGRDGGSEAAGAMVGPDTMAAARAAGVDARDHLARNDSGTFFERIGGTYVPGPTRHNLNDARAIVIQHPKERGMA
ncbi:MAG: MOFRL family protein, partial [Trueperaceae bacterium]